jgi:hypothetical protein
MSATKSDQTPMSREVRAWTIVRLVLGIFQMLRRPQPLCC